MLSKRKWPDTNKHMVREVSTSSTTCPYRAKLAAKVMGIKPNTIPNRKTSIIFICSKGKKKGNIYP